MDDWLKERNDMLISGDEEQIRAYFKKLGVTPPADSTVLWAAIHKARTAWTDCPLPLRMVSLQWLMRHDMKAME